MVDKRLKLALLCVLVCRFVGNATAQAQPPPTGTSTGTTINREYENKAAYIYHFATQATLNIEEGERIVLGVLGDSARFGNQLNRIQTQSERIRRPIQVELFRDIADYEECDILFISGRDAATSQRLLRQARERTEGRVLIITENTHDFNNQGATFGLYVERNRTRFLVNLAAARAARARIPETVTRHGRVVVP